MPVDTAASNLLFLWTEAKTRPGVTLRSRASATHVVVCPFDHRFDCLPSVPMYSRPRGGLALKGLCFTSGLLATHSPAGPEQLPRGCLPLAQGAFLGLGRPVWDRLPETKEAPAILGI